MKLKKILLVSLMSMLLSTGSFASNQDIKVTIDGIELKMDVAPISVNNRTLVPMRSIFEAMGLNVEWNDLTKTARGTRGSDEIRLQLGNEKAIINGREVTLDAPATALDGRILVPIRFIAESLKSDVEWNSRIKTVIIRTELEDDARARAYEIQEMWGKLKPTFTEVKYQDTPQTTAPYKLGKLTDETLNNALNITNFIRFIAYLPSDVVLDEKFNVEAQAASLVNAANGTLTHSPQKPGDMHDDSLYQLGKSGAQTSNISMGRQTIIDTIVQGYMSDAGASNIDRVGHRRWILFPKLKKTGFGMASPFSAMKVIEGSRGSDTHQSFDYVSWPARTAMPNQYFEKDFPWSISLDDKKYDNKKTKEIKVELTRINDNKKWDFSSTSADGYFNIDTGGYGTPFAIIFRPEEKPLYKHQDKYRVTVSNIYKLDGSVEEISFETTFFNLKE